MQREMIIYIFRAIQHDCAEAKMYIPCILDLPKLKNNLLTSVFKNEIDKLPEWIFLGYISQILSNFDFEDDCYLDSLIMKIASKYPRALYFAFIISYEHYKHQDEDREMEKPLIQDLKDQIQSPLLDQFVEEIGKLCLPGNMFFCYLKNFSIKVAEQKVPFKKLEEECERIHEMFKNKFPGKADEFEAYMKKLKNLIGSKNYKKIVRYLNEMMPKAHKLDDNVEITNGIELHRLSNWLAEYKWLGSDEFLEQPGQYDGISKPVIESHVKIVRFESKMKIFHSKQKPMELKIYGNDGKTYKYIIKFGEDCRQDQRIQQILKFMNDRLSLDKNCLANHLKIETYHVTPLNHFCGMLSVVENTTTVRDFINFCSSNSRMEPTNISALLNGIRAQFNAFLERASKQSGLNIKDSYANAIQKYSKKEFVDFFQSLVKTIPHNVFKLNLMKDAISPETFYIMRKNFINSLVSMNIAHW